MKGLVTTLCVFLFATWGLAAPIVLLSTFPDQSDDASTHVRHKTQHQVEPLSTIKMSSFLAPSRVSTEKHPNIVVTDDGRRIQLPENLAGARSWETPNVIHFLTSLARPKKQSPFPESSIMREETRANTAETEPQESIVELETKAERESWTYLPYMSQDNVVHFHCVRKAADTVMLAVPLAAAAMILMAVLSGALRYTFGRLRSSRRRAILLDDEADAIPSYSPRATSLPYADQSIPTSEPNASTIDEKS
ncbi:hypothetical protein GGS26DRAFT_418286 [Hypomontagnella submonticulosa]|nr:hypothetical protein GGS26DRAFT_418286 [Hypomontagnella submonticulosa]